MIFLDVVKQLWMDCTEWYDYIIAIIIYCLMVMAFSGIGKMIFELVTNPSQFDNVQFGIFDYCC